MGENSTPFSGKIAQTEKLFKIAMIFLLEKKFWLHRWLRGFWDFKKNFTKN